MARECRPLVCPNVGFERQLRLWRFCECDVYVREPKPVSAPKLVLKEKTAYKVWKAERDNLLNRGEEATNKARFSSMATMAAEFGKMRLKANQNINSKGEEGSVGSEEEERKRKSWERAEKMEKDWNRRLIAGEDPPETGEKQLG